VRGTASFDVFCVNISVGASAVASLKNPKKRNYSRTWGVIFHAYGYYRKTPGLIWSNFCTWGDIRDIITCAKFGNDRLRGFSVAMGQILGFTISFRRRPYNTFALAYRVSVWQKCLNNTQRRVVSHESIVSCYFILIYFVRCCCYFERDKCCWWRRRRRWWWW